MTSDSPTKQSRFARYRLLATLVLYVAVQILWVRATPTQSIYLPDNLPTYLATDFSLVVGLGPDEKEHYLYVLSLADNGRLPKPSPAFRASPDDYVSYQAQHPPLFYALSAVIYKAAHPLVGDIKIWYLLRGFCVLCGLAVIVLTDRAAKTAFPDRPLVALGTAPFVAFLPMFGHMTGNFSNEPLAMLFGAAVWLQSVRLLRRNTPPTIREALLLGLTLALACLTRLTALLWLPVVSIALLRRGRVALPAALAGFALFALLLAPWFAYNQVAYGHAFLRTFDRPLLARGPISDFFGRGLVPAEFPVPINSTQSLLWYAGTAWLPFWLTQFYMPDLRPIFLLLDAGAVILLVLNVSKLTRDGVPDASGKAIVGAAFAATLFCFAALIQQELFADWNVVLSAGRYLVAAAPATGLLFLLALSTLRPLNRPVVAALVAAVMLAFDVYAANTVRQFYGDHPTQAEIQPITK